MESSRIGGRTHTRDVLLSTGNGRHVFLRSLLAPVTSNAGREGPQVWCVRGQPRGGRFQCCFGHRGDSGAPVAPGCTTSPRLGRRRHSAQPFGEHVSLRGSVTPYNKVPPGNSPSLARLGRHASSLRPTEPTAESGGDDDDPRQSERRRTTQARDVPRIASLPPGLPYHVTGIAPSTRHQPNEEL